VTSRIRSAVALLSFCFAACTAKLYGEKNTHLGGGVTNSSTARAGVFGVQQEVESIIPSQFYIGETLGRAELAARLCDRVAALQAQSRLLSAQAVNFNRTSRQEIIR